MSKEICLIKLQNILSSNKLEPIFLGFINRYHPKKALVVNLGYQGKRKIDKTEVFFIYPYKVIDYA